MNPPFSEHQHPKAMLDYYRAGYLGAIMRFQHMKEDCTADHLKRILMRVSAAVNAGVCYQDMIRLPCVGVSIIKTPAAKDGNRMLP